MERRGFVAEAILAGAELTKVFCGFGDDIGEKFED